MLERTGATRLCRSRPNSLLKNFSSVHRLAVYVLLLAGVLAVPSFGSAQQSKPAKPAKKHGKASAAPTAPPAPIVVPFKSGESLDYRVLFSKYAVNAAKIEIMVVEQRNFFGHPAWHFRASAHTMDTTRTLFPLDDQFDSYTSAANLFSLQFEEYLHERGETQTNVYRMTSEGDPSTNDATAVRVAPGTRDAIGFLFDLRAADWQKTPELHAPIFDGRKLYDGVASVDTPQGSVTVPAGTFPAFRVAIHLFEHGKEITDTKLWVWFTKDAAHTPVLVEAEIPFGTARVELTHLP
jgi:hypothetical protein